ncbi:MAG: class I SAM-dependent methyltransferase [Caldilineaceae bacterium]|nr:class I SAM-dependent methyltransferase [Caldilineaceae bacterium]
MAELKPTADHVDRIYGDHYFAGGGDGYPDYLAEAELLTAHGERYGVLLAHYMAPGTVLDVGAAAGFLLQGLQRRGWHGVGLEPNGRMVAHGREQLGLDMLLGDLEHFAAEQRRVQFDLVTMIQVIGHFHDINRALSQAATLTKVGGYWLIESWDRASWPARLLGPHWHEYSPPSVLHWFARTDLVQLAAKHGFRLVAQGRPQKWLNAAHAKSLLRYKFAELSGYALLNGLLRLVPDNLALPYPTFDLFWVLLQKQNDDNV